MKTFYLSLILCVGLSVGALAQPSLQYATIGFSGYYDLSKWTKVANTGYIDVSNAPAMVTFISGNDYDPESEGDGYIDTTYMSIIMPADGQISFSWSYATNDGPEYDYPVYILDGEMFMFPGYVIPDEEGKGDGSLLAPSEGDEDLQPQYGQFSIHVEKGQTFAIGTYTVDGCCGSCSINAFNFNATSVPFVLPAVLGIFGLAGLGAVVRFRRRKK